MQSAKPPNQLVARPQIKMIRVGKDDFRAELFKRLLRNRFDGSLCPNGQKKGCLHHAVRRSQAAAPRTCRVGFQDFKRKTHPLSVSGEDERPTHATNDPDGPNAEGDCKGFRALQLFGIHGGEPNCQQNERPEGEKVNRLAKSD